MSDDKIHLLDPDTLEVFVIGGDADPQIGWSMRDPAGHHVAQSVPIEGLSAVGLRRALLTYSKGLVRAAQGLAVDET